MKVEKTLRQKLPAGDMHVGNNYFKGKKSSRTTSKYIKGNISKIIKLKFINFNETPNFITLKNKANIQHSYINI